VKGLAVGAKRAKEEQARRAKRQVLTAAKVANHASMPGGNDVQVRLLRPAAAYGLLTQYGND
jgi:hypothetical protein